MRAVIQRVKWARVEVDGKIVGKIGPGIVTFLGVAPHDGVAQVEKLVTKILNLRIFEDDLGKMNRSLIESRGEHLIVSQFTLYANTKRGNRPSFMASAPRELAERLYLHSLEFSGGQGVPTQSGQFRADMNVELLNQGPITLMLDTDD